MREAGMTMNDRVALARAKRINKGDVWPGDRPDFDGSVRHVDWKDKDDPCSDFNGYFDASPEYVGSRAKTLDRINELENGFGNGPFRDGQVRDAVAQIDGRPVTVPSSRPVVIRLVDVKVYAEHPRQ
jgi:hypothetical protein